MARVNAEALPQLLVLGDSPVLMAKLQGQAFAVRSALPAAVFTGVIPDLVLVAQDWCEDPETIRLRADIGLQDVPFVALQANPSATLDYDDWFDIGSVGPTELAARLSATLNGARLRAAGNRRARILQLLDESVRSLTDPAQITYRAAGIVGVALGVNRCAYADVDEDQDGFNLTGNYNDGVDSIVGRYHFSQFGAECLRLMRAGEPYVVEDCESDPRTEGVREAYRMTAIRAVICVPVMKEGRFVAAMAVHMKTPRSWDHADVRLLCAVADRCWESIERAKVERELRAAVSDTLAAQHALEEASERLQFTLDSAHIADWDLDLDEQVCMRSLRHDRLFGYREPLPEWNIERLFEHVHPDDVEEVRDSFELALLTRGEWHFECRVVWADGSVHWIAGSGYHYTGPASARRRMLGIVYDVSASKRAIIALREADRRKDEFLAMLAHELRNPLAPISSAADLLSVYAADANKVMQASAVISRQVRHMKRLIEDLLDVSRVTRGLVKLDKRACDMAEVVALAVEQARPFIDAHEHRINVQLPGERTVVMGDQARLVQVVANLLNNAAKYTPDGGRIIVRLDVDERHVACSVIDNGIGMSGDFIDRAFELFSQAETGLARTHGGLGLGLALVRSLVNLHDGSVSARSEGIGLGAQFVVMLPRARPNVVPQLEAAGPVSEAMSVGTGR